IFPVDEETLRYLAFTGRSREQVELVEAYMRAQGLFHDPSGPEPVYSETLELDLGEVVPSLAGPTRPQDRVDLDDAKGSFRETLLHYVGEDNGLKGLDQASLQSFPASDPPALDPRHEDESPPPDVHAAPPGNGQRASKPVPVTLEDGTKVIIDHGTAVIAAI